MRRFALRVVILAVLLGAGWVVGHAQGQQAAKPDFEIAVVAPTGTMMTATCVRGCQFQWVQQQATGITTGGLTDRITYRCGGSEQTCTLALPGVVSR